MKDVFCTAFYIKEKHLDTYGHVNNATYLELFEEARWDFITENGYGLDYVKTEKIGPIVLEIQMKFRKELNNREKIRIESKFIERIGRLRFSFEQTIYNQKGQISCVALFVFGLMDLSKRKLIHPPDEFLNAFGASL